MALAMGEKQQDVASLLGGILLLQKSHELDRWRWIAVTLDRGGNRDAEQQGGEQEHGESKRRGHVKEAAKQRYQ